MNDKYYNGTFTQYVPGWLQDLAVATSWVLTLVVLFIYIKRL